MSDLVRVVEDAAARARGLLGDAGLPPPRAGIVLGSGLGDLADALEGAVRLPAADLEGYPASTVEGHEGTFLLGRLEGLPVVALKGRIHAYEGHALAHVGLPVRIMGRLGIGTLVVTNAAGGLGSHLAAGDLMLLTDHVNLLGGSPLEGPNEDAWGPRFPDMSAVYPEELRALARDRAGELGLTVKEGVYGAVRGPQYETPAEIRMLSRLGIDAVGMSTVPEAIVAAHMGIGVLGISLISNLAAGRGHERLSHEDVLEAGRRAGGRLSTLVAAVARRLAAEEAGR